MVTKLHWVLLGLLVFLVGGSVGALAMFVGLELIEIGGTPVLSPSETPATITIPTPDSGTGKLSGRIWHDLCLSPDPGQAGSVSPEGCTTTQEGVVADGILTADEAGIAGVTVQLRLGACPGQDLITSISGDDGSFSFLQLAAGEYCVSVDPAEGANASILLPGIWSSPRGSQTAMRGLDLVDGETKVDVDFGWDYLYLPLAPTPTATITPTPTPTLTPTVTVTPPPVIPCDWASFVKDITVPAGTVFQPEQDFRKTWRLKNIGTCTWTADYDLVFVGGNRMTGDRVTALTKSVRPGESIDVSIELTAPAELGRHTGRWALRNAQGIVFGLGPRADEAFSVVIQVEKARTYKLNTDLADQYCDAVWVSAAGLITCPTDSYDISGFIQHLDAPVLEGNRVENEHGLWVIPEGVPGGYISGTFPPIKIAAGDRFRTVMACLEDYVACDVEFRLEYQVGGGELKTLGKWRERYDHSLTRVDLDLTPLAGKEVQFILTVSAGDAYDQDSALWLRPSIWR